MSLTAPPTADALRPSVADALDAWGARVRADRAQVERSREVADPTDFYGPIAGRFRHDPRRRDDPVLEVLDGLARTGETWLDIGAGGGRFALPLALRVREVLAIDPSPGMLDVLREGMREHGIGNVRIEEGRWPERAAALSNPPPDVALMAHIGYDIEAMGPFLDAMEAASRRLCAAVMGESAMTTIATLFWEPVHGEPRVPLPALPELLALLIARGRLPELRLVERVAPTFNSYEDLLLMARRQLWLRPDSAKDTTLQRLLRAAAVERDGRWGVDQGGSRIGVATWEPTSA